MKASCSKCGTPFDDGLFGQCNACVMTGQSDLIKSSYDDHPKGYNLNEWYTVVNPEWVGIDLASGLDYNGFMRLEPTGVFAEVYYPTSTWGYSLMTTSSYPVKILIQDEDW